MPTSPSSLVTLDSPTTPTSNSTHRHSSSGGLVSLVATSNALSEESQMSTQASSSVPQRPQKSRSNLNGNTGQRSSRTSGVASTQSSATSKLPDPMAMTSSIDQDLGVLVNPSSAPPSKLGPSAPAPPGTSLSTSTTSTSSFSSLLANFNSKFVVSSTTITSNPIPEQSSSSAGARATPLAAAIGRTEWDSEVGSVETVCSTPTKVSVSLPSNSSSLTSPTLTRDNVSTNSEDADSDLGSRKQVGFLTYMKEWEELEVGAKKVKEPGVKDTDGRVRVRPGEMRIKMGKAGGRVKSKMRVEVVVPPSAAAKAAAVIKPVKESGKGRKEKGASDSVGMEEITKTMSTRVGVPPLVTTAAPGVQSTLASTPVHAPTAASSSFKLQETPKATTSGTNAVTSSAITTPIAKPPAEPFIDLSLTKPKTKRRRISGGSAAFSLSKSTPDAKFSVLTPTSKPPPATPTPAPIPLSGLSAARAPAPHLNMQPYPQITPTTTRASTLSRMPTLPPTTSPQTPAITSTPNLVTLSMPLPSQMVSTRPIVKRKKIKIRAVAKVEAGAQTEDETATQTDPEPTSVPTPTHAHAHAHASASTPVAPPDVHNTGPLQLNAHGGTKPSRDEEIKEAVNDCTDKGSDRKAERDSRDSKFPDASFGGGAPRSLCKRKAVAMEEEEEEEGNEDKEARSRSDWTAPILSPSSNREENANAMDMDVNVDPNVEMEAEETKDKEKEKEREKPREENKKEAGKKESLLLSRGFTIPKTYAEAEKTLFTLSRAQGLVAHASGVSGGNEDDRDKKTDRKERHAQEEDDKSKRKHGDEPRRNPNPGVVLHGWTPKLKPRLKAPGSGVGGSSPGSERGAGGVKKRVHWDESIPRSISEEAETGRGRSTSTKVGGEVKDVDTNENEQTRVRGELGKADKEGDQDASKDAVSRSDSRSCSRPEESVLTEDSAQTRMKKPQEGYQSSSTRRSVMARSHTPAFRSVSSPESKDTEMEYSQTATETEKPAEEQTETTEPGKAEAQAAQVQANTDTQPKQRGRKPRPRPRPQAIEERERSKENVPLSVPPSGYVVHADKVSVSLKAKERGSGKGQGADEDNRNEKVEVEVQGKGASLRPPSLGDLHPDKERDGDGDVRTRQVEGTSPLELVKPSWEVLQPDARDMSDSEDEDENEVDELQDEEALTISLDQMQSPAAQEQGKGVGVPEMAASPTYRGSEQLPPSSPLSVLEDKQDQEDGEQHEDALSRSSPISLPPLLSSPPPLPPALLPPTPPTATSNAQKRPYDPHRKSGFLGVYITARKPFSKKPNTTPFQGSKGTLARKRSMISEEEKEVEGLLLTPSTSPSNDKSTKTTPRTPLSQSNSSASLAIALMSTYTKPTPSPTRRKIQPSQRGVSRKRQRSPSSPAVDGRPLKKLDLRDYFARMREKAKGEAELRHQEASMTSGLSKPKLSRGNEEPERVEDGRDQALSSPQSRSRDQNSKDGGSDGVITEIGISEADMLLAPTGAHAIGMMEEHTMLRMSLGRRLGLPVRVIGEAAAGQQERQELLKQSLGMAWRRRPLVCRPFVRKTERYLEALESAFGPGDVTRGDGPTKPVSLQPNANKRKRPSYVYNGQSSESEWEEAN